MDGRLPIWLPHQMSQCLQIQMVPEPNFVNCDMVKTFLGKYPDDESALLDKSRVDKLNKPGCEGSG